MHGRFNDDSILVPISIWGVSPTLKKPFTAIVDTGFSGYLTLPFAEAFPLGLVLKGEQSHALADGSIVRHFVCVGTVEFEGTKIYVPIDVQPGGPILMGMQLLKKFNKNLVIEFGKQEFTFGAGTETGAGNNSGTGTKRTVFTPLKDVKIGF